jgi:hypothetical protein
MSTDPDFATRDLHAHISEGKEAAWRLSVQVPGCAAPMVTGVEPVRAVGTRACAPPWLSCAQPVPRPLCRSCRSPLRQVTGSMVRVEPAPCACC